MEKSSPFYLYHPDSIGWLHRRHAGGQEITKADIARLLRADPANGDDPLWKEYALKALESRLPKKRGRKPMTPEYKLRLGLAAADVEERAAETRRLAPRGAPVQWSIAAVTWSPVSRLQTKSDRSGGLRAAAPSSTRFPH